MSTIKHFIDGFVKKMEIDEFLEQKLERAGYGGADITKTPLGTRVTIYAMKPGIVIGRGGESIKDLSKILEEKFGLANPQIAVAEIEVPELNPHIMATRITSALQRGIHFRRAGYWALSRIMSAGALGAEITIRGKLTTERARYEKYRAGYLMKTGEPALKNLREAVAHIKLKPGLIGVKVRILPPKVELPYRVSMKPLETEEIAAASKETEALPERGAEVEEA